MSQVQFLNILMLISSIFLLTSSISITIRRDVSILLTLYIFTTLFSYLDKYKRYIFCLFICSSILSFWVVVFQYLAYITLIMLIFYSVLYIWINHIRIQYHQGNYIILTLYSLVIFLLILILIWLFAECIAWVFMDVRDMLNRDPDAPNTVSNTSTSPGGGPGQGGTNPPPVTNQGSQPNSNPDDHSNYNTTKPSYNNPFIVIRIKENPVNMDHVERADARRIWNEERAIHFEHYPIVDGDGNVSGYMQQTRDHINEVLNIKSKVFTDSGSSHETDHYNFDQNRARFLKSFY